MSGAWSTPFNPRHVSQELFHHTCLCGYVQCAQLPELIFRASLRSMHAQNTYIGQAMAMTGIVLVLLLVSRAVFLFPILAVHNFFSGEKLPIRHTIVAW